MSSFSLSNNFKTVKIIVSAITLFCATSLTIAQNIVQFDMRDHLWPDVFYTVSYDEEEGVWKWTSEQLQGASFSDYGFYIRKDRITFALEDVENPTSLPVDPKQVQRKYFIVDREGIKFNDPDKHIHIDFVPSDNDKFLDAYFKLWFMLTKGQVVPPPRDKDLWENN